jgi:hypothetical protein
LNDDHGKGVVFDRTENPFSRTQVDRLSRFDDGSVFKTNIIRGAARKNPLYRSSARAEEFAELVVVEGLRNVVEEKNPEASAEEHSPLLPSNRLIPEQ